MMVSVVGERGWVAYESGLGLTICCSLMMAGLPDQRYIHSHPHRPRAQRHQATSRDLRFRGTRARQTLLVYCVPGSC